MRLLIQKSANIQVCCVLACGTFTNNTGLFTENIIRFLSLFLLQFNYITECKFSFIVFITLLIHQDKIISSIIFNVINKFMTIVLM